MYFLMQRFIAGVNILIGQGKAIWSWVKLLISLIAFKKNYNALSSPVLDVMFYFLDNGGLQ